MKNVEDITTSNNRQELFWSRQSIKIMKRLKYDVKQYKIKD